MFKKTLLISLLFSFSAHAQFRDDIAIRREIPVSYAKLVVADAYTREENLKLPTASEAISNKMLSSLNGRYIKNIKLEKDAEINTIELSGEVKGETAVQYHITRSLRNCYAAYAVINGILNKKPPMDSIQDLNGNNISTADIKVQNINNENFLIFSNDTSTFIEGNLGSQINVQIQTEGADHQRAALDFVKSLSKEKFEKAVNAGEYKPTLADIDKEASIRVKDKELVKKLFGIE